MFNGTNAIGMDDPVTPLLIISDKSFDKYSYPRGCL